MDAGIVDVRLGGPAGIRDAVRERHALAARCLYGQPFGFTLEDVRQLRIMRDSAEWGAEYSDNAKAGIWSAFLDDLLDRIETLLQPVEPAA